MTEITLDAASSTAALSGNHPLDHPIWGALTTRQKAVADGNMHARRYPAAIAPFAAIADTSPASFVSLGPLILPGDRVAMFTVDPIEPPPAAFEVLMASTAHQMVGTSIVEPSRAMDFVHLGEDDVPEMMELVARTNPGPFSPRTLELGTYLGIRVNGQLVAMAGERFKLDGFTEISAVCTDPAHRGHGYARDLVTELSRSVVNRDDLPFLHVFTENAPAIALYRKLGFELRRTMCLTVLGNVS
jgi:predicted GNAT family acetyltransferase